MLSSGDTRATSEAGLVSAVSGAAFNASTCLRRLDLLGEKTVEGDGVGEEAVTAVDVEEDCSAVKVAALAVQKKRARNHPEW